MQVSEWKKLQESLPGAFQRGKKRDDDFEAEREKLHSKNSPHALYDPAFLTNVEIQPF